MKHVFLLLLLAVVMLGAGCGGGGNNGSPSPQPTATPQAPGSVRLTIAWPSRIAGRGVPLASESVVVIFEDASHKELTRATALRVGDEASTSDVLFTNVPVGNYFVAATAYPQADGTGTALAQATFPITVASGKETAQDLSL